MDEENKQQPIQPVTPAPIYQESQEKNAKWLWILIILIIIGALVFAFFRGIGPFAAISPFAKSITSPTPEASSQIQSSPMSEATSSPSSIIDRGAAKVKVLNGSGVTGKASATKDFLEKLGWKVATIGNADSDSYKDTEVLVKDSTIKYEDTMIKDLSDKYSAKASTKSLDASDSADIEVIVGSK